MFQCRACRTQTSARAGTIFHKSRTPLAKWFLAMHLITASKNDIAALELARQLDVKWDTAWLIKQKLLEVMLQRNSMYKLAGDIQVDDAYQGGEKAGKPGRGAANKLPFVIAVATRDGHPIYTHLRVVPGFTKEAMRDYATGNIEAGARVLTDGLACFNGFDEAGLKHVVKNTGGGRPTRGRFQMGQHWARQCEGRHHRHVPLDRHPPHATLPRRLRMALQPPLRPAEEPRTSRPLRRHRRAQAPSPDRGGPTKESSGDTGVIRNMGAYSNPKLDEMTAQIRDEIDEAKRNALIHKAFKLVIDDYAIIPLFEPALVWATRKNVKLDQRADERFELRSVVKN